MLTLANAELTVDLIDPAVEQARLGPRYCWGGYIWQVQDRSIGTLLTGPEWPELTPLPHNGQGLPESFRHSTTEGAPLLWDGAVGLAPGSGALGRDAGGQHHRHHALRPGRSTLQDDSRRVPHRAERGPLGLCTLERTIELRGRRIVSRSRLTNRGTKPRSSSSGSRTPSSPCRPTACCA
jgi:hypothetical protein